MGVYIKDMELPKGADECRIIIRANGQVIIDKKTYWEETEAVPVPPHGRLIDQDAILREVIRGDYPNQWIDKSELLRLFRNAPTIIEPEEGE